ncbi:MAG: o-succinylbenzoate synthase [Bacteroidia bacterium]
MKASFTKYTLRFKQAAGTSKGVLNDKVSYFIFLEENGITGIGEASLIPGISPDDPGIMPGKLAEVCQHINSGISPLEVDDLNTFPSIRFALETARLDLKHGGMRQLFSSEFARGEQQLPINGLIWMAEPDKMLQQIQDRISEGFRVIKMKIGSLDFEQELKLLKQVRKEFSADEIEIRLDANGAFQKEDALSKLKELSEFKIHSIEQPIRQGQWQSMAKLCSASPIPIALDEELTGIIGSGMKQKLLQAIQPSYIILKLSLTGGFIAAREWIKAAEKENIGWWITSALESNIGLNAIAQFAAANDVTIPQGLGTGKLFVNNISSPLEIKNGFLYLNPEGSWDLSPVLSSEFREKQ